MNELIKPAGSEIYLDQISDSEPSNEKQQPQIRESDDKLIPRHQNKMVAERTTDMFMSGMMCE